MTVTLQEYSFKQMLHMSDELLSSNTCKNKGSMDDLGAGQPASLLLSSYLCAVSLSTCSGSIMGPTPIGWGIQKKA